MLRTGNTVAISTALIDPLGGCDCAQANKLQLGSRSWWVDE